MAKICAPEISFEAGGAIYGVSPELYRTSFRWISRGRGSFAQPN